MNKLLLLLLSCLAINSSQGCKVAVNSMAFHPDTTSLLGKDQLPAIMDEVFFKTSDDIELQGLYLPNNAADRILIYFHGNAGNIYHRIPDLMQLYSFGLNVLGVSYRGYGRSEGRPSEAGIYLDGDAALKYVTGTLGIPEQNIIIFGRSIGSTVALETAQHKKLSGMILVSPMTTGKAMAKAVGLSPVSFLAGDAFNNLAKIKNLHCTLLVVHGTNDEIIPFSMGKTIYEEAAVEKHFATIEGAGHNDISSVFATDYWPPVNEFLQLLKGQE